MQLEICRHELYAGDAGDSNRSVTAFAIRVRCTRCSTGHSTKWRPDCRAGLDLVRLVRLDLSRKFWKDSRDFLENIVSVRAFELVDVFVIPAVCVRLRGLRDSNRLNFRVE